MIQISQIKLLASEKEETLKSKISKILNIKDDKAFTYKILKKSIDARKDDVYVLYSVGVYIKNEKNIINKFKVPNIIIKKEIDYRHVPSGQEKMKNPPIIVGSGPAGLFCGYMLADYGYSPIIIERGSTVEKRTAAVEKFWNGGKLDTNCNVQFGEGGAGTFSDGKLNTLVKDKFLRNKKVLDIFVENGAKSNILYDSKPHIGTDILVDVVKNMREHIIKKGGKIIFDTTVTQILLKDNAVYGVKTSTGESIYSDVVVLALGHSARDTFKMLNDSGIAMSPKAFAVGVRVEHPQEMISVNQYKKYAKYLPPASYKVTHQTNGGRGIYSFCMCPGGYVVNASSQLEMTAVNGMSYNARESKNANSAMIVTVTPDDFDGRDVLVGIRFQQKLERTAYIQGKGNIPVQLLGDFVNDRVSTSFGRILPQIKGKYEFGNLNMVLPKYICEAIVEGMGAFDKKIPGFNNEEVILSGVESRTSSPVRIIRDNSTLESISHKGIYPCGEGAGYAGGIMSAAMDGIKVFEAVSDRYSI